MNEIREQTETKKYRKQDLEEKARPLKHFGRNITYQYAKCYYKKRCWPCWFCLLSGRKQPNFKQILELNIV